MNDTPQSRQTIKASSQLFQALRNPESLCLQIDSGGFIAISKDNTEDSRFTLFIDPREAITAFEKEIGEPIRATLERENRDPILVAASLRLRARRLNIPTTAPLNVPMKQPSWPEVRL